MRYSYDDLLSAKRDRESKSSVVLSLKTGDPSHPRVTRIETHQVLELNTYMHATKNSVAVSHVHVAACVL